MASENGSAASSTSAAPARSANGADGPPPDRRPVNGGPYRAATSEPRSAAGDQPTAPYPSATPPPPPGAPGSMGPGGPGPAQDATAGPPAQIPSHSSSVPLALAAVALLLTFVLVGWFMFQPATFTQKLITFGVGAGLMVWVVSVIDGAQRRSIERLQRRMELQQAVAVAEARAAERGKTLDAFMSTFVSEVHGSIGQFPPHVTYGSPYYLPPPAEDIPPDEPRR